MNITLTKAHKPPSGDPTTTPQTTSTIPVVCFDMLAGTYKQARKDANLNVLVVIVGIVIVLLVAGYGYSLHQQATKAQNQAQADTAALTAYSTQLAREYNISSASELKSMRTQITTSIAQIKAATSVQPDLAALLTDIQAAAASPGITLKSISVGDLTTAPASGSLPSSNTPGTPGTIAPGTVTISGTATSAAALAAWEKGIQEVTSLSGTEATTYDQSDPNGSISFITPATLSPTLVAPQDQEIVAELSTSGAGA